MRSSKHTQNKRCVTSFVNKNRKLFFLSNLANRNRPFWYGFSVAKKMTETGNRLFSFGRVFPLSPTPENARGTYLYGNPVHVWTSLAHLRSPHRPTFSTKQGQVDRTISAFVNEQRTTNHARASRRLTQRKLCKLPYAGTVL